MTDEQKSHDRAAERRALSPVLSDEDFRPLSATARVEFGAWSDGAPAHGPGNDHYLIVRLEREQETIRTSLPEADVPHRFQEYGFAMVLADGIGSAAGGLASRIAVTTLVHLALHYGRWNVRVNAQAAFDIAERLDWYYKQADKAVKRRAQASPSLHGMATAVTAAYSAGDELFVAHTGPSLAYVYREGRLQDVSQQSLTLAGSGATKASRGRAPTAEDQELSSMLSHAVGAPGRPVVWIERFSLRDGDTLMLCSESLTTALSEDTIADILADRRRPDDVCRRLVAAALDMRPGDSVTVLLAEYRIPERVA